MRDTVSADSQAQPRSQGSLLPTLRRVGRRELWERGCRRRGSRIKTDDFLSKRRRPKLVGLGVFGGMLPQGTFFDFDGFLKSTFPGFLSQQTGYWQEPITLILANSFSSDETLQIGGLFRPSVLTWKAFLMKNIFIMN